MPQQHSQHSVSVQPPLSVRGCASVEMVLRAVGRVDSIIVGLTLPFACAVDFEVVMRGFEGGEFWTCNGDGVKGWDGEEVCSDVA